MPCIKRKDFFFIWGSLDIYDTMINQGKNYN